MAAGLVVTIRVNPTDCMAVVDTLKYLGIPTANLSFAQCTKLVLASALESFRQQGIAPVRTGFEYMQIMEPFTQPDFSSRGAKLKQAELLNQSTFVAPAVIPETPERARRRIRYEELYIKFKHDEINLSVDEKEELRPLMEEFYT